jgi:hypothetical protein
MVLPNNINNDDIACRICYGDEHNDFIVPCSCKGTMKFVHRQCLDTWRATNIAPQAFTHCPQCKFKYELYDINYDPKLEMMRKFKFVFYMMRDMFMFFIANVLIVGILAFLIKEIDINNSYVFINTFANQTINTTLSYHILGLTLYFALIGIVGLIWYVCNDGVGLTDNIRWNNRCDQGACQAFLVIFLIVIISVGIVVGVVHACNFIKNRIVHHTDKLWKLQQVQKYVVKDLRI